MNKTNETKLIMILIFIILLVIIYMIYQINLLSIEKFEIRNSIKPSITSSQSYANSYISYDNLNTVSFDRTKLYGSIFLNNIDEAIKNMTEPNMKFYKTHMQLNDYQDIIS